MSNQLQHLEDSLIFMLYKNVYMLYIFSPLCFPKDRKSQWLKKKKKKKARILNWWKELGSSWKTSVKFGTIQRHGLKALFHLIIPFPTCTLHYSTLLCLYNPSRDWNRKEKKSSSGGNGPTFSCACCRMKSPQSRTGLKTSHALSTDEIILHPTLVWNSK